MLPVLPTFWMILLPPSSRRLGDEEIKDLQNFSNTTHSTWCQQPSTNFIALWRTIKVWNHLYTYDTAIKTGHIRYIDTLSFYRKELKHLDGSFVTCFSIPSETSRTHKCTRTSGVALIFQYISFTHDVCFELLIWEVDIRLLNNELCC
jgi:hypothetical protein